MALSFSLLALAVTGGLGFLVFISLAILDRFEAYKLSVKGKLKGADITQ